MLEDRFAQHDKIIVDKFADPSVSYYMTTRDYVVRPSANALTGPISIYLPPVADAQGRWYSVIIRDADGTNTVTIRDLDDSECWPGDVVCDAKCDRVLAYSDGLAWIVLGDVTYLPTTAPTTGP